MPKIDYTHLIGSETKYFRVLNVIDNKNTNRKRQLLECECKLCGKTTLLLPYQVTGNLIKSCGCIKHRTAYNATHKLSKENLYHVWETMRLRCTRPSNKRYYLYGARGIKVCDEWFNNYLSFREWAISNGYRKGLTLDRIDTNGNYEPNNCRWVTVKEQQSNRRITIRATIDGVTKPIVEWCRELGISHKTVTERIRVKGMTPEEAILTPIRHPKSQ